MRDFSLDGLDMIYKCKSKEIYRIDDERIIKVYEPAFCDEILLMQKDMSDFLNANGVRTVKMYENVTVDERYGIIQEYIDGEMLNEHYRYALAQRTEAAEKLGRLLKKIHSTTPDKEMFRPVTEMVRSSLRSGKIISLIEENRIVKALENIEGEPVLLHGHFFTPNIIVKDEDYYLTDVSSMCIGPKEFDLMQIFCDYYYRMPRVYAIRHELTPSIIENFLITLLSTYYETEDTLVLTKLFELYSRTCKFCDFVTKINSTCQQNRKMMREYIDSHTDEIMFIIMEMYAFEKKEMACFREEEEEDDSNEYKSLEFDPEYINLVKQLDEEKRKKKEAGLAELEKLE